MRRAIHGLRAQRERLLDADHPAAFDLDFYAHAAYQLREAIRMAMARAGLRDELAPTLQRLDDEVPNLSAYRDAMAHALEQNIEDWYWFGTDAVKGRPGGQMEWLIDARDHHRVFEELAAEALRHLDPDGSLDRQFAPLSEGKPATD